MYDRSFDTTKVENGGVMSYSVVFEILKKMYNLTWATRIYLIHCKVTIMCKRWKKQPFPSQGQVVKLYLEAECYSKNRDICVEAY